MKDGEELSGDTPTMSSIVTAHAETSKSQSLIDRLSGDVGYNECKTEPLFPSLKQENENANSRLPAEGELQQVSCIEEYVDVKTPPTPPSTSELAAAVVEAAGSASDVTNHEISLDQSSIDTSQLQRSMGLLNPDGISDHSTAFDSLFNHPSATFPDARHSSLLEATMAGSSGTPPFNPDSYYQQHYYNMLDEGVPFGFANTSSDLSTYNYMTGNGNAMGPMSRKRSNTMDLYNTVSPSSYYPSAGDEVIPARRGGRSGPGSRKNAEAKPKAAPRKRKRRTPTSKSAAADGNQSSSFEIADGPMDSAGQDNARIPSASLDDDAATTSQSKRRGSSTPSHCAKQKGSNKAGKTDDSSKGSSYMLQQQNQQNQIFVFSSKLANQAAKAVGQGRFPSIIAFHKSLPATARLLSCLAVSNYTGPDGGDHSTSPRSTPGASRSAFDQSYSGSASPSTSAMLKDNLTPEQLRKRQENLAKLQGIGEMLNVYPYSGQPSNMAVADVANGRSSASMCHVVGLFRHGNGVYSRAQGPSHPLMMSTGNAQHPCVTDGSRNAVIHTANALDGYPVSYCPAIIQSGPNGQTIVTPRGPPLTSAQLEWQRLQAEFFEKRAREQHMLRSMQHQGMASQHPAAFNGNPQVLRRMMLLRAGQPERFGSAVDFLCRTGCPPNVFNTCEMRMCPSPKQMSYEIDGQELIITKQLNKGRTGGQHSSISSDLAPPLSSMLEMTNSIPQPSSSPPRSSADASGSASMMAANSDSPCSLKVMDDGTMASNRGLNGMGAQYRESGGNPSMGGQKPHPSRVNAQNSPAYQRNNSSPCNVMSDKRSTACLLNKSSFPNDPSGNSDMMLQSPHHPAMFQQQQDLCYGEMVPRPHNSGYSLMNPQAYPGQFVPGDSAELCKSRYLPTGNPMGQYGGGLSMVNHPANHFSANNCYPDDFNNGAVPGAGNQPPRQRHPQIAVDPEQLVSNRFMPSGGTDGSGRNRSVNPNAGNIPPSVNNTYVNATMSIQQLNIQSVQQPGVSPHPQGPHANIIYNHHSVQQPMQSASLAEAPTAHHHYQGHPAVNPRFFMQQPVQNGQFISDHVGPYDGLPGSHQGPSAMMVHPSRAAMMQSHQRQMPASPPSQMVLVRHPGGQVRLMQPGAQVRFDHPSLEVAPYGIANAHNPSLQHPMIMQPRSECMRDMPMGPPSVRSAMQYGFNPADCPDIPHSSSHMMAIQQPCQRVGMAVFRRRMPLNHSDGGIIAAAAMGDSRERVIMMQQQLPHVMSPNGSGLYVDQRMIAAESRSGYPPKSPGGDNRASHTVLMMNNNSMNRSVNSEQVNSSMISYNSYQGGNDTGASLMGMSTGGHHPHRKGNSCEQNGGSEYASSMDSVSAKLAEAGMLFTSDPFMDTTDSSYYHDGDLKSSIDSVDPGGSLCHTPLAGSDGLSRTQEAGARNGSYFRNPNVFQDFHHPQGCERREDCSTMPTASTTALPLGGFREPPDASRNNTSTQRPAHMNSGTTSTQCKEERI